MKSRMLWKGGLFSLMLLVAFLAPGSVWGAPTAESGEVVVERVEGTLKVGMSSVSIDPPWPVYVPYGERVKVHEFYGGPTYVKAVVFQVEELKVAWVVLDVIGINWHRVNFIKERIASETGLKKAHIMVQATHCHCYPRVREGKILDLLAERSAQAVKEALEGLFETRIGIGHRVLRQDLVVNRDNFDGPVSSDLYVMRIEDGEGVARGVIFNFPAHPVIFTKSWGPGKPGMIGPDWPGMAREYIELQTRLDRLYQVYNIGRKVPADIFTMFTQGGCGSSVGLGAPQLPIEEVDGVPVPRRRNIPEAVARNVLTMLSEIETAESVKLEFRWQMVKLPPMAEWIRERLAKEKTPSPWGETTLLQAFIFNDETVFCTFPGELTAELVVAFRKHSGFKNSIVLDHANDHISYIRPEGEVIEGIAWGAIGGRTFFGPKQGPTIMNAALKLVNPHFEPFPPFDERTMGTIRGNVDYDGEQRIEITVMNVPHGPRHGPSKKVDVGEKGTFEITHLLPGAKFLSVIEVAVDEENLPLLRGWPAKERTLISNHPVTVRAGRESAVHFHLYQKMLETEVKALRIEEIELEGHQISGRVQVEGKLGSGERIDGGIFPFGVPLRHGHLVLNQPVRQTTVEEERVFLFEGVPAGKYRAVFWLDVNGNTRREPWADLFSPPSKVLTVVE
ncbi:MAG: hypothetical protein KAV99_01680 [Candidatus Latescibacteria bacterium]|nr:hypothetical protein [Candidatus Latescibacterota bacterium]